MALLSTFVHFGIETSISCALHPANFSTSSILKTTCLCIIINSSVHSEAGLNGQCCKDPNACVAVQQAGGEWIQHIHKCTQQGVCIVDQEGHPAERGSSLRLG